MGQPRSFTSRVKHIAPGSPVSASNASAPDRQLEQRTNELLAQLDAINSGQLLVYRAQTVVEEAQDGQPVFWNDENQRFELALAAVETDTASGTLVPAASADCLGLVFNKTGPTTADIATVGMINFADLSAAIDGDIAPGRYYLSAGEEGKLVKQRPAVTVAVCYVLGPMSDCDTDNWVFILPQMRDFQEDHIHYRFDLTCRPAGDHTPPVPGDRHTIENADATLPGWLPADHTSFEGHAPSGAKFGYNLAVDTAVQRVWPPVPVEAALMLWDRADGNFAGEIPSRGQNALVRFDRYGIWWMSDCYADVPWPVTLDTTSSSSVSITSESSSAGDACPRTEQMRLVLAFLHMIFATDRAVVTSLQPASETEPIAFTNCDGEAATTGDLFARLRLEALIADDEYYGGRVFKELVGPGLTFGLGYVAEGLIAGSSRVLLTSQRQRRRTPGDATTPLVHQGLVTVDVDLEPGARELTPQVTYLGDALERTYQEISYLALPPDRDSGIRMRFNVPANGVPTSPRLTLQVWVFGRADGPFAEVTASYYRIAAPTPGTPTPITAGDTTLTLDIVTPSAALTADNVILVSSEEFEVAAGDTVMISINRAQDAEPDYAAEIGFIRVVGILAAGTE
jgi:hypothetical protein